MDYRARFYSPSLGRFIQPDTLIPSPSNPQTWNRYAYSLNNPTRYADPSGHWIETAFDVASILFDVADIAQNGLNWSNGAALAVDIASAILPGIPAVGGLALKAAKAANAVDNVVDAAKVIKQADNILDTANAMDNLVDIGKAANQTDNLADVVKTVCSFSADTEVTTSEGSESISAIEIGDYVLAWNEADGTLGYYAVTDTFSHADEVLTELIIDGEWIETTPEHPFYTDEEGWLPADELKPGLHIRRADGTTGIVWLKWNVHKTQALP